jgi:hypothetical protein
MEQEPLSPELVLVDPALRARALRQLRERPLDRPEYQSRPVEQFTSRLEPVDAAPAPRRERTARRRFVAAAALLLLCLALLAFGRQHRATRRGPSAARTVQSTPRTQPERPVVQGARPQAKQAGAPPARRKRPPRKPTAPPTRRSQPTPGPCAVLDWQPAAGATFYDVVLWRNRKRILDIWPTAPRTVLPGRWTYRGARRRLRPGRYLWFVYPGFDRSGARTYGRLRAYGTLFVRAGASPCIRRVNELGHSGN